jgi:4-amino-4-deoxy-L-arabinose transferase-like glycosyltransferase
MSTSRSHEMPHAVQEPVSPPAVSATWLSASLPLAGAIGIAGAFVLLVLPDLKTLPHDFDEAWLILDARAIAHGLRPFVDFPHHEMPLHLYLLQLFGRLFGQTLVGYRLLSVASLVGSGLLLFCLARPFVGVLPALIAEAAFLWSPAQMHALPAIPETPTLFFTLLGVALVFLGDRWWSAVAGGVVFVLALFVKPTCIFMVVALALSLAIGREWRRLGQLALSGLVTAVAGIALWVYLSDGVFADLIWFQVTRIGTRSAGMWTIDSGITDMARLNGLDTPLAWAFSIMRGFFDLQITWIPMGLFLLALSAIPIWVLQCARSRRALQAFTVLWPAAYCFVNFVALDFVSPRYFVAFLGFSGFLLAGWFWLAQRWLPAIAVAACGVLVGVVLASQLASALRTQRDPYVARAEWLAARYAKVVSFSPILFAAAGTDPGCDFWNPALTYEAFGEGFLLTERARRFRVSDAGLIDCLKANPEMPVVVDWGFYFFTRPHSALRRFLAEEGNAKRRLFSSEEAVAQWDQPLLKMDPFR